MRFPALEADLIGSEDAQTACGSSMQSAASIASPCGGGFATVVAGVPYEPKSLLSGPLSGTLARPRNLPWRRSVKGLPRRPGYSLEPGADHARRCFGRAELATFASGRAFESPPARQDNCSYALSNSHQARVSACSGSIDADRALGHQPVKRVVHTAGDVTGGEALRSHDRPVSRGKLTRPRCSRKRLAFEQCRREVISVVRE